jgi:hypothetical protein
LRRRRSRGGIDFEVDFGIDFGIDFEVDFDFGIDFEVDFDFGIDFGIGGSGVVGVPGAARGAVGFAGDVGDADGVARDGVEDLGDGRLVEDARGAPLVQAGGDGPVDLDAEGRAIDADGHASTDPTKQAADATLGDAGAEAGRKEAVEGGQPAFGPVAVHTGDVPAGLPEDRLGVGSAQHEAQQVGNLLGGHALPPFLGGPVPVDLGVHDPGEAEAPGQAPGQVLVFEDLRRSVVVADRFQDRQGQLGPEAVARFLRRLLGCRLFSGCGGGVAHHGQFRRKGVRPP